MEKVVGWVKANPLMFFGGLLVAVLLIGLISG